MDMNNKLYEIKFRLTSSEATSLAKVFTLALDKTTYEAMDVNPVWVWGLMQNLSTQIYVQGTEEPLNDA